MPATCAREVDKEEHVVGDEPAQRPDFGCEKSVAAKTSRWEVMNSFQVVPCLRSGAGRIPWRRGMLPTVSSHSGWPRFSKAPAIRS